MHFFGFYIGNYPTLERDKILRLCDLLNGLVARASEAERRLDAPVANSTCLILNPASRTQVYQALGSELAAVENPVWAGLMATFCPHRRAVGRDHRRARRRN